MEQSNGTQLLNSLQKYGVLIPPTVNSIKDITPSSLITICSRSLRLIDPTTTSFPTYLPEEKDDDDSLRLSICADFASAFKDLGFVGHISSQKFLYPSEEDLYKLVGFMVEKLSELSRGGNSVGLEDANGSAGSREGDINCSVEDRNEKATNRAIEIGSQTAEDCLREVDLPTETSGPSEDGDENLDSLVTVSQTIDSENFVDPLRSGSFDIREDKFDDVQGAGDSNSGLSDDLVPEGNAASHNMKFSNKTYEIERLKSKEKLLQEELSSKTIEIKHLEEELELLNAAAKIASDAEHSTDSCVEQLNKQVESKRLSLVELESEWDAVRKPLENTKRSLEESLYDTIPDGLEKLRKIKQVELEKGSVLSEIENRKEEQSMLIAQLEKQPKVESRRSHIQRIMEITKNSRKQDADIERILKETRELQLENNSIQERLDRSYAVLDELVFREAKKDPAGRQAYRLLTSIHETFGQIMEKILASDRLQREVANYEAKLAAMTSRSINADKLQADLDVIRKENESMEHCLWKN